MKRRDFLQASVLGGALALGKPGRVHAEIEPPTGAWQPTEAFELDELTISDLQQGLASGKYTSKSLVKKYLERINDVDRSGPAVNSVIEIIPMRGHC